MLDSSLELLLLCCFVCWRDGGADAVDDGDFGFCFCVDFGVAREIDFGAGLFRFATNFVDVVLVVLSEFADGVNM